MNFMEFVDRKHREAMEQLETLKSMLEQSGFMVKSFANNQEDPYIYVNSPINLSFGGIRVYKIGEDFAYRVCQRENTHPYGEPYSLAIEKMIEDFSEDDKIKEEEILNRIIKSIVEDISAFFEKSFEAEQRDFTPLNGNDPLGQIAVRTTGTDYSATVTGSNKGIS